MDNSSHQELNNQRIFDHKPGLFVLFFTEMWERFSYYGMRVLLVVFLVEVAFDEQWSCSRVANRKLSICSTVDQGFAEIQLFRGQKFRGTESGSTDINQHDLLDRRLRSTMWAGIVDS